MTAKSILTAKMAQKVGPFFSGVTPFSIEGGFRSFFSLFLSTQWWPCDKWRPFLAETFFIDEQYYPIFGLQLGRLSS